MKRDRRKPRHCSFCGKPEGDARLVALPGVTICRSCIDLCADILIAERESGNPRTRGWESWSNDAVTADIEAFHSSRGRFVAVSERTLARRLGSPDDIAGGMEVRDQFGKLNWIADRAFLYLSLLPRTVVRFDLLDGKVRQLSFFPKWKRCPESRHAKLGKWYAPESLVG